MRCITRRNAQGQLARLSTGEWQGAPAGLMCTPLGLILTSIMLACWTTRRSTTSRATWSSHASEIIAFELLIQTALLPAPLESCCTQHMSQCMFWQRMLSHPALQGLDGQKSEAREKGAGQAGKRL